MMKRSESLPPSEQPAPKRTHTMQYAQAIAEINKRSEGWAGSASIGRLAGLLAMIIHSAPLEACINKAVAIDPLDWIERFPDLEEALKRFVESRNCEEILSMDILKKKTDAVKTGLDQTEGAGKGCPSYAENENIGAVFNAFATPYVDGFPQALLETVDKYCSMDAYNKAISIIQSSGTGKSRGVAEAAKVRFTFLFNLRRKVPHYTYPPPDKSVRDFLLSSSGGSVREKYFAFLYSLFSLAPAYISGADRQGVPLAQWWYNFLNGDASAYKPGSKRVEFYDEVVEGAKGLLRQQNKVQDLRDVCRTFVEVLRLEYSRDKQSLKPHVACLLVFDEAQELHVSKDEDQSDYHILGSVLKEIREHAVFSVFLSTNSSVRKLAPPVELHPSARLHPEDMLPRYPPLNELPFDVFARNLNDILHQSGRSTLNEICTLDVMARFGRTLWYPLLERGYDDIVWFAKAKVNPTGNFGALAQFACLAIRIGLDFDTSREIGRATEMTHVESYMRIVFAVPPHREFMRTGTPSEPILAEAAARLLNENNIDKLAPRLLADAFDQGFLARGERGEMVARLLWILARDLAVRELTDLDSEPSVMFQRPIPVLRFLHCLFPEKYWKVIDNAKPIGNEHGPTLSVAFKNAFVCFSHFMDAVNHEVDLHQVYQLFLRGAALSCQRNQTSIDFLTPIFFGSPDDTLRRSCTSVLQAQVKNRDKTDSVDVDPTLVQSTLPVISLVHELGTKTSSVESSTYYNQERDIDHSQHYKLVSRGCTSETFRVIPNSENEVYTMLLGSNQLMKDFPRGNIKECADLFTQLNPCSGLGGQNRWFGQDVE